MVISHSTGVTCFKTSKGPSQESENFDDKPGVRTNTMEPG